MESGEEALSRLAGSLVDSALTATRLALVVQSEPACRLSLNKFLKCYESLLLKTQTYIFTPTTHSNINTEKTKEIIFRTEMSSILHSAIRLQFSNTDWWNSLHTLIFLSDPLNSMFLFVTNVQTGFS